ncbi:hypothetical protein [Adlercreutzia agrestimuris]|uniref:hypothetical protein n=1 Tax=Adlercreutzia agrestimuris TaxID=2941324 RepID=UPI00203DC42A|nr:hypothetical protein [Adlercreutzia agrestimuris]
MAPRAKFDKESYDWLNDPFDEKKIAKESAQQKSSSFAKVMLIVGCFVVIAILAGLVLMLASLAAL